VHFVPVDGAVRRAAQHAATAAIWAVVLASSSHAEERAPILWPPTYERICGPYSVGVVLRLLDRPLPFDEVCRRSGYGVRSGTTLAGLMECLESCGLHSAFVDMTVDDCFCCESPMILCFRSQVRDDSQAPPYHFVAAVPSPQGPERVLLLLTNRPARVRKEALVGSSLWTGKVLIVSESPLAPRPRAIVALRSAALGGSLGLLTVSACSGVLLLSQRRRRIPAK